MAKSADTLKDTVEQYSAAGSAAFKDGVEKSLASLNDINAASKQNLEALVTAATAATKGAEALGAQAIAYSKKAVEDNVAAAKSLGSAKSLQEVVELQTTWFKSSLEAYIGEFNKAAEIVSGSVKETWTPINSRVTATVEKFQTAR
jgi:phasin family protein